jgi:hypothetical protein
MEKKYRFILLGIQGLLTIGFILLVTYPFYLAIRQGTDIPMGMLAYSVPTLIHLLLTFAAALMLSIVYRTNIGPEAQFVPILFLVITMESIRILPLFADITHRLFFDYPMIAVVFQFCFLFSSFLFLASGLFLQSMNVTKMGQYVFVAASWSLFLSIIVPVSTDRQSYEGILTISSKPFIAVCILINVLAVLTFLLSFIRDKDQRRILVRCISFSFIIVGNTVVVISVQPVAIVIGLLLYAIGIISLLAITRTYHIWK